MWRLCAGMQQQAEQLVAVAQAPCNHVLWRAPTIVFHFTGHLDQDIAAELRAMGAIVTGPGPLDEDLLPPPPPPPAAINLDVTTLCGLVSEVSHCRHGDGSTVNAVQQWAARVSHWQVRFLIDTRTLPPNRLPEHCSSGL